MRDVLEYHPGQYDIPRDRNEAFQICVGAILTQNVGWRNVESALINLRDKEALLPKALLDLSDDDLRTAIRPAGYYNQKAKKLRIFTRHFLEHDRPDRDELLGLWGIGPETADSMLLYAFNVPIFVVDAYTRRVFPEFAKASYDEIQERFHASLPEDLHIYQEYHALIVRHAKEMKKNKITS